MDEAQKIYEKLNELQKIYGWGIAISIIVLVAGLILLWKLLDKKIELKATENFEKRKTEHSVRFSLSHEKQINAMHNCYSKIQKIRLLMLNRDGDDKFNQLPSMTIFNNMIAAREDFKSTFYENRIVFSKELCSKIDNFFPRLDDYLTELNEGFGYIEYTPEQLKYARKKGERIISGMWIPTETEKVREPLDEIISDIDDEFRKIQEI